MSNNTKRKSSRLPYYYVLLFLGGFILTSCSQGPGSNPTDNNSLTLGVVTDNSNGSGNLNERTIVVEGALTVDTLIQAAIWNPLAKELIVTVNALATDQRVEIIDATTQTTIDALDVFDNQTWQSKQTTLTLKNIPCRVQVKTATRTQSLPVIRAPQNCDTVVLQTAKGVNKALAGNTLPTTNIIFPSTSTIEIGTGQSIEFVATINDAEGNGPYTYLWTYGGAALGAQGQIGNGTSSSVEVITPPIFYNRPGNYTTTFRATDATGAYPLVKNSVIVIVSNTQPAPTPVVTPIPSVGPIQTPTPTQFPDPIIIISSPQNNATVSTDQPVTFVGQINDPSPYAGTYKYLWDFGGLAEYENVANQPNISTPPVVFRDPGSYTIALNVAHNDGSQYPASPPVIIITAVNPTIPTPLPTPIPTTPPVITPIPTVGPIQTPTPTQFPDPIIVISSPQNNATVSTDQPVTFVGQISEPSPYAGTYKYLWDFGGLAQYENVTNQLGVSTPPVLFSQPGSYTIALNVAHNDGSQYPNAPPVIIITATDPSVPPLATPAPPPYQPTPPPPPPPYGTPQPTMPPPPPPISKAQLGELIFFDQTLSEPTGQACGSCHVPDVGWTDPDKNIPVSEGVIPGRFGTRNAPTVAYAAFNPPFNASLPNGGQFHDGRSADLIEQAKQPFLNQVEMNNPNFQTVVDKVQAATYAASFEQIYGPNAFSNPTQAFNNIADAIATFESTSRVSPFASKFDLFLQGQATLTADEQAGLNLFNAVGCSFCHTSIQVGGQLPLFTNFSYFNLGLPTSADPRIPPQDIGVGNTTAQATDRGEFKTPTLRNVAKTAPYMHNGIFNTLDEVVSFYNTRDVDPIFSPPDIADNKTPTIGNFGLTPAQKAQIVAFLRTLSDNIAFTPLP